MCAFIDNNVNQEMTNDSWAKGFGINGYFPMNQFWNDMSDEEITFDIYHVAKKKKIYTLCLRNALHTRRPDSNQYVPYEPPDAIVTENSPPLDGVDATLVTAADAVDVAGDDDDDGDTTADKANLPPFISIAADNTEAVAIPNTSIRKSSSKCPRKKLVSFKNSTVLGAMPAKPIIVNILPKAMKKTLLLGTVSAKKKLEKDAKAMLLTANSRISNLESHIQLILQPKYEETHAQLVQSVASGWNSIYQQDQVIMTLRAQKCELDKQLIVLKETISRKDLDIATLKGDVATATKVAAKDSELIGIQEADWRREEDEQTHVSG